MITIKTFILNPIRENTYVVSDETGECVIVDAGASNTRETDRIVEYIDANNLKPVMLINTHGHFDHILGVQALKERYGIPFAVRREDFSMVENMVSHGMMFGMAVDGAPTVDIDLADSESIKFGQTELKIIHTPGHTPGHVSFYDPASKSLFTGDVLFKESIGRTDLPGGDYKVLMDSIFNKILPLGSETKVYAGHGYETSLGHEAMYNPFITEVIKGEVKPY